MNTSPLNPLSVSLVKPLTSINGNQLSGALKNPNMEQLGFMAGGIVHDFNNLLTSIMGHVSLALLKMPSDNPAHEHVEKALKATRLATLLTAQLLTYARAEEQKPEEVDLNRLLQDTINLLADVLLQNARIRFRLFPALPLIEAVAAEMQQVVMNLAVNAAESIDHAGGELVIETGRLAAPHGREPLLYGGTSLPAGEYIYFSIQDNGKGMDEATLAHIFDPFFSTKPYGGGLGLPTTYDIVKRHNGGIVVESQKNQGAKFTVFFPVHQRAAKYLGVH
jgi:two-component system, cell cycle sensor histidine kinase and response regulator CckA